MSADADPRILALLEAHAKAVEAYGGTAPNIRAAEEEWDQAIASLAARVEELQAALEAIREKAAWYSRQPVRQMHEVDHALCVEVLVLAEDGLERAAGQGRS